MTTYRSLLPGARSVWAPIAARLDKICCTHGSNSRRLAACPAVRLCGRLGSAAAGALAGASTARVPKQTTSLLLLDARPTGLNSGPYKTPVSVDLSVVCPSPGCPDTTTSTIFCAFPPGSERQSRPELLLRQLPDGLRHHHQRLRSSSLRRQHKVNESPLEQRDARVRRYEVIRPTDRPSHDIRL